MASIYGYLESLRTPLSECLKPESRAIVSPAPKTSGLLDNPICVIV